MVKYKLYNCEIINVPLTLQRVADIVKQQIAVFNAAYFNVDWLGKLSST